MKVFIICTQLEAGGAQRASIKLSQQFRNKGISCENLFLYKKRDSFKGIEHISVVQNRLITSPLDYIFISYKLIRKFKRDKPDVVITFTHYANILGLLCAYLAGVKTRIASHRNPSWGDMSKLWLQIDEFCAKRRIYTQITAVSKSTKSSFEFYPTHIYERITVINNGIEALTLNIGKREARQQLGLPIDSKIIGTIGRLSYQKNHKTLIEAMAKVDTGILVIAGEGELRLETSLLIDKLGLNDKVILLGEIRHDYIPLFLKAIDLFVMPSLFEGLSNALIEAMSMGVPVLTSDIDSQKDVVISDDGTLNGILLPAEDADMWGIQIKSILTDNDKLSYLSHRSLVRASDFTVEKMSSEFLKVINN
ncbi:glycosyltransferase family 4 protein [Spirosoma oryzicola]|uniref:glycosyltransferase family 4 protein n=1 Tax=Spirosoma oryzicola TaxID=2898794 RepID=UPI001E5FE8FD|nr:glycosyltransferase family 4 protein [Spirosoma oryzicola]UHG93163.1 glycosyltransferase family 4 protein [Spirosoma oryzicola]